MLAPSEMYVGSIGGTKFLMRLNALPAYAALIIGALLLSRMRKPQASWSQIVGSAVGWIASLESTKLIHTSGHIVSARLVGAPMDAVILTYSLQRNLYLNDNVMPVQHIGRALGGPIFSGAAAGIGYWMWRRLRKIPLIGSIAQTLCLFNTAALLIGLLPLKPFDGYVLLRWSLAIWRRVG
ncbi:MAG: hypothetical protein KF726_27485 [Anaerolineae bacterium]|nr:hypothetical protein [Anaerolineae bacterium]